MAAWREMSMRQCRRRNASEEENKRLKELVTEQRGILRGLQRFVQRQLDYAKAHQSNQATCSSVSSWPGSWSGDTQSLMQLLAELLAGIKTAYNSTDSRLLSRSSLNAAGLDREARLLASSPTQMTIEVSSSRFFPSDFHSVAEAYWLMGLNYYCRDTEVSRERTEIEGRETLFVDKSIEDQAAGPVNVRKHSSVQRFAE
ncbi:hypothetical protein Poli38472_007556 [Pythium oligandrum]|uniref:Uncharacterized protein n=1 Tax=Pythium oligandrum TaxID=41045 RepID=A0A8K1CQR1_PYTOL|nr:hypothetical protein Poli38472_007556 [Pythium oligandrum]|eukprot:TMW67884.1 hypothetical protein Poli38472_007556 [Pythium oligandrum]